MASNIESGWMSVQAFFQAAVEGEDVKNSLIECLDMLNSSHTLKVNKNIKSKPTSYTIHNSNVEKKYYEVTISVRMLFDDTEGNELPIDYDFVYKYTDCNGKKNKVTINNRMTVYYSSNKWILTLLKDTSNGYTEGYEIAWPVTRPTTEVVEYFTFDPET